MKKKLEWKKMFWNTKFTFEDSNNWTIKKTFFYTCSLTWSFTLLFVKSLEYLNQSTLNYTDKVKILNTIFDPFFNPLFNKFLEQENTEYLTLTFSDLIIYLNLLL